MSQAHRWISKYEEEQPEVTVEIGDDGLPVEVFERHKLSPRKSARVVTHQQRLDSWRLLELVTFRQQQQQKQQQEKEQPGSAGDVSGENLISSTVHASDLKAASSTSAAAGKLNSKSVNECRVQDVATTRAATADSAVQRMFSGHSMQHGKLRQRGSLHVAKSLSVQPRSLQQSCPEAAFVIPTTVSFTRAEPEMAPKAAMAGDSAGFGGRAKPEENLWGGVGGFGRNGRSKGPGSSTALQTPRPIRYCCLQDLLRRSTTAVLRRNVSHQHLQYDIRLCNASPQRHVA